MPLNPFKNMLSDSLSMTNKNIKRGNNPTGFNFTNPIKPYGSDFKGNQNIVGMNQGGDSGLGQGTIMGSSFGVGGEWNPFAGGGNLQEGFTPPDLPPGGAGNMGTSAQDQYDAWIDISENMLNFSLTQNHLNSLWNYLQGNSSALGDYDDPYAWMLSIAENTGGTASDFDISNPFGGGATPETPEAPSLLDNLVSPTRGGAKGAKKLSYGGQGSSVGQFAGYGNTMLDNLMEEY